MTHAHQRSTYVPLSTVELDGFTVEVALSAETLTARNGNPFRRVRATVDGEPYHAAAFRKEDRLAFAIEVGNVWRNRADVAYTTLKGSVAVDGDLVADAATLRLEADPSKHLAEEGDRRRRREAKEAIDAMEAIERKRREKARAGSGEARQDSWSDIFSMSMDDFIRSVGTKKRVAPATYRSFADPVQQEAWDAVPAMFADKAQVRQVRVRVNKLLHSDVGGSRGREALLKEVNALIDARSKHL